MNDNQVDDGHTLLVVDGITSDYYRGGPEVARPLIQDLADDGRHPQRQWRLPMWVPPVMLRAALVGCDVVSPGARSCLDIRWHPLTR